MRRLLFAILLCLSAAVPASAQEAPTSAQPDLYAFWVNAELFRGNLESSDTVGLRLAANVGEATFVQLGAQLQTGGLIGGASQTAFNVGIGRSTMREAGTLSAYAGPVVAFSKTEYYLKFGALAAIRGDLHLFYGIGVGLEMRGNWVPGVLSGEVGLSLTFGGFDR